MEKEKWCVCVCMCVLFLRMFAPLSIFQFHIHMYTYIHTSICAMYRKLGRICIRGIKCWYELMSCVWLVAYESLNLLYTNRRTKVLCSILLLKLRLCCENFCYCCVEFYLPFFSKNLIETLMQSMASLSLWLVYVLPK